MNDEWFVGLFDGEGCITASMRVRQKDGYERLHLRCSVEITQEAVVRLFEDRFGGCVHQRVNRGGRWVWTLSGGDSVEFLSLIASKGVVKGHIAEVALPLAQAVREVKKHPRRGKPIELILSQRVAALELKSLNGARSRFAPYTVT